MNTAKNISIKTITQRIAENKFLWVFSFTLLTVVSAQIAIPIKPVPITVQTMAVILSGAFLGAKKGAYSQLIYLFLGVIGLPVFAQIPDGALGFTRLFGPTGGYLLAFPIAAFVVGYIVEKHKSYIVVTLAMFLAEIIILFAGTLSLYAFYVKDLLSAVESGAAVFSIWMVIKTFTASTIYFGIKGRKTK